ncbi:MAG: UDP-2,3-diacylglucosamine diphosphatase [Crocinitomicaceae bacterium]|nr:UDP-2,3-diacylglucosamine diphosphatase [Crocinitomicaceae bacterium]MBK8925708.1 UDP-2,3-diacylglucosamine diphosphatase [Crocinitomicaceae bacterium]
MSSKKIYFASDFHLGAPPGEPSAIREKRIVAWLDEIKHDAQEIFLLGDVFDFWFEYRHAVPKGFVRLQGKIAELTDSGIQVHWFIGNHDMWIFDYIPAELGVTIHRKEVVREFSGKKFFIGHGDGLGPGDHGYKFIKKVFRNKICQWFFARFHPNFGIGLANFFSRRSRRYTGEADAVFYGEEKEMLIQFCKKMSETEKFDYFVFGHRHLPIEFQINESSVYINTGDWIKYNSYAVFDGQNLTLLKYLSANFSEKIKST